MQHFANSVKLQRKSLLLNNYASHIVKLYATSDPCTNYTNFGSFLATYFFSQFVLVAQPRPPIKMENRYVHESTQTTEEGQSLLELGYETLWYILIRLKDNFSNGFRKGLENTFQEVIFWVMSWKIWETYNAKGWISYLLT